MQKHGSAISMRCMAIRFWITAPTEVSNEFGSFRLSVRLSIFSTQNLRIGWSVFSDFLHEVRFIKYNKSGGVQFMKKISTEQKGPKSPNNGAKLRCLGFCQKLAHSCIYIRRCQINRGAGWIFGKFNKRGGSYWWFLIIKRGRLISVDIEKRPFNSQVNAW